MSDRLDHGHLDDSEREWLRATRRRASRKTLVLVGVLAVAALALVWLTRNGIPGIGRAPATTTPEQQVIADGEKALADWGEFAVSNDLSDVKDSFWANGPQYKQLAKEAKAREGKPPGPPPYKMTMTGVQVISPSAREDQRVLRGQVQMTRPGEEPQTFKWDVWLQLDPASEGRWRLWTVRETSGT